MWPNLEFRDIWTYLIRTEGSNTKKTLKGYKSLEVINYYHYGYVCSDLLGNNEVRYFAFIITICIPNNRATKDIDLNTLTYKLTPYFLPYTNDK